MLDWVVVKKAGLYCQVGDFYIDPYYPVAKAVITHGHADHARAGHQIVWATEETAEIMQLRYGQTCAEQFVRMPYGQSEVINGVRVTLISAGHILGSAQVLLEYGGERLVITGDFKRDADPTCPPFQPVQADYLITEATFGLPVFVHPPIEEELAKLCLSLERNPDKPHLLGCYALGKAQRVIMGLRAMGYHAPIYHHGAMTKLCEYYQSKGCDLGEVEPVGRQRKADFAGSLVLCPPSALVAPWGQGFPDAIKSMASGWLRIRARSRQRRVELPLVISDHADWPSLLQTVTEVNPRVVYVTHGREDALVYQCQKMGYQAQALSGLRVFEEGGD